MKYLTPKLIVSSLLLMSAQSLFAQDAADVVILPEAAQACVLPSAPDAIPEDADKDTLLAAKKDVGRFQGEVESYRGCLSAAETDDITPGNKEAIVQSYNYSVEMEERVAQRFNDAVRAFKERQSGG